MQMISLYLAPAW